MKKTFLVLAVAAASIPAATCAAQEVVASGCARAGVEAGCVVIGDKTATYDISSAKPKPKPGQFGTVKGVVFDGVGTCMQGKILSPATWSPDPSKTCP